MRDILPLQVLPNIVKNGLIGQLPCWRVANRAILAFLDVQLLLPFRRHKSLFDQEHEEYNSDKANPAKNR